MIAFGIMTLAVMVGALVQGTIGVGFALIAAPVIAVLRPDLLPGSILVLMVPLNAYVAWRERAHFDLGGAGWITGGRVAGTFAGVWILLAASASTLNAVIGATMIFAAIATKLAPKFAPTRTGFVGAGLMTGMTETATGIGGPPLALVYQHHAPPTLRGTIALCFLLGELFSLLVLGADGRLGPAQVREALLLAAPLALGLLGSSRMHERISAARLRDAVLLFAGASGLLLIVQAATK